MNIEELRDYALSLPGVTEGIFMDEIVDFRVEGKWFMLYWCWALEPLVAVKCDPETAIELRERYRAVEPAYHMNKRLWNDIYLTRDMPGDEIKHWVRHSYEQVIAKFPKSLKSKYLTQND